MPNHVNKQAQAPKAVRRYTLPLVVFLTGAAVLVIEVAAIRILSPYFGNTLYMTSSVLGVILAALSLGYYMGGRLADKRPSEALFFSIILAGGVATLVLQLLTTLLLPAIGYNFSIISGPLIMSLIIFFLPALLLGMLSPFVIKLQAVKFPQLGTGTVAGEVFFWSTLGSITGSLATGFVLVPFFGLDATMLGTGVFLVLLGLVGLIGRGSLKRPVTSRLLAVAAGLLVCNAVLLAARESSVVYSDDGLYQRLVIYDGMYGEQDRPTRFFRQDRNASSAMYLHSDELVYDYTKYYELYRGVKPDADQALVIGGAAYSIPKALLADSPDMQVDVSEIEPSTFELAQQYFRVKDSPRLTNYVTDGRRLLATSDKQYDLIFSDVYFSLYSIPHHFTTVEFFETAKQRLSQNGIFVANLIGDLSHEKPSFTFSEIKTFRQVFDNVYVFAATSPEAISGAQNIMLVGVNGDKQLDLDAPIFTSSQNDVLRSLPSHRVQLDETKLARHMTLTDDHAPVAYLLSRMLREAAQ